jgi:hypothetical protein
MDETVDFILKAMSSVKKPQRIFMVGLLSVLQVYQGKATFRNLSRYSELSEKRFSRWYRRTFDFSLFNRSLLTEELPKESEVIGAIDASFVHKNGKKTEGLGYFYNGKVGKAEKGLEMSLISLVDLTANTSYAITAQQTIDCANQSRVDLYAEQVRQAAPDMKALGIKYLAADSYYSKVKFIDAVCAEELDIVGKLRIDADLQWLNQEKYKGRGRPKKYDGKVNIHTEKARFNYVGTFENKTQIYSEVLYSKTFKRNIQVILLHWVHKDKEGHALLFSTSETLDPLDIIRYYKARFQIEFLFRDAKQYTGLMDCQARNKKAIQTHINASLSALNLLKLEDRRQKQTHQETVISIASWKRKKFNQHLMLRLFEQLGLSRDCEKTTRAYEKFSDYGAIAA